MEKFKIYKHSTYLSLHGVRYIRIRPDFVWEKGEDYKIIEMCWYRRKKRREFGIALGERVSKKYVTVEECINKNPSVIQNMIDKLHKSMNTTMKKVQSKKSS